MKNNVRLYMTNAPQAYDYGFTLRVGPADNGVADARIVAISGSNTMIANQIDRYASGMYFATLLGRTHTTIKVRIPVTVSIDLTTFSQGFDMERLGETLAIDLQRAVDEMDDRSERLVYDDDDRPAVISIYNASIDDDRVKVEVL